MPRIRFIKHDFFLDDDLANQSHVARLMFIGLWILADREGRLEDKPAKIKAMLFPYEQVDADSILQQLSCGFILRYSVSGKQYIQINNFLKHQRPHIKETSSNFPAPEKSGAPGLSGEKTPDSGLLITDSGLTTANAPAAVIQAIKSAAQKSGRRLTESKLSDARLPFAFGDFHKGAMIQDLPVDTCAAILARTPRLGAGLVELLNARIAQKKAEAVA